VAVEVRIGKSRASARECSTVRAEDLGRFSRYMSCLNVLLTSKPNPNPNPNGRMSGRHLIEVPWARRPISRRFRVNSARSSRVRPAGRGSQPTIRSVNLRRNDDNAMVSSRRELTGLVFRSKSYRANWRAKTIENCVENLTKSSL
jgi:hypothetical protein